MNDPEAPTPPSRKKPVGRPPGPKDADRIHISVPASLREEWKKIQDATHAGTLSEYLKQATKFYNAAYRARVEENRVTVLKNLDTGEERQLLLFI